jgi:hypothetical protein
LVSLVETFPLSMVELVLPLLVFKSPLTCALAVAVSRQSTRLP